MNFVCRIDGVFACLALCKQPLWYIECYAFCAFLSGDRND